MDITQQIQRLLAAPNYHPLRRAELAAKLKLNGAQRREFRRILAGMVARGEVARVRQDRFVLPQEADLVAGRIEFTEKGFAFVIRDKEGAPDIYVAEEDTGTALHGDKVLVRLQRERRLPAGGKPAGRVIRILERANDTLVGTLQKTGQFHYLVPDDPRFAHNVYTKPAHGAQVGDKVVVKLAEWTSRHINPEGTIVERLGKSDAPGVDILAIIRQHKLPTKFAEQTLAEVERIPATIPVAGRLDLRGQFILTIDPDDAKDFDDAVNVEELPDGGWRLGVHIADVSHYVTPGSALDREARSRGNSVYLVDRVIPMLPEKLSNGLCSLRPREDRLTQSCLIEFTPKLTVRQVEFHRSVIHSRHRLTYREAFARLQSPDGEELTGELKKMWRLAGKLRRLRFERGALDLDFPEMKVRLDAHGRPTHIEKVENDIAHQLIEEFMLAANEAVARHLCQSQIPCVHRIHENPDPDKLHEFRDYAKTFGLKAGDLVHREQLQKLLKSVEDRPEKYAIHMRLLRSLKQARYAEQPVGHYGLAKKFYTHFTSPIRRYADLIVHRTLAGQQVYPLAELAKLAEHISGTERTATEAERESVELKKLELFDRQLQTGRREVLHATVSGVRNFGFFVELTDSLVQGLVHVSTLGDDFYHYDQDRERLVGKRTRRIIQIGDRLRVQVDRVDLFKRQIDFRVVSD
jgi:ribonuclease R